MGISDQDKSIIRVFWRRTGGFEYYPCVKAWTIFEIWMIFFSE